MSGDLMIETIGLSKSFGKLMAVNGLNLNVQKGSIHGFIGPNGAGKSTTMKMLIGSIRSTGGKGFINGHPIGSLEARRTLGFSPERPSFYPDMSAWKYLVYMGRLAGMSTDAAQRRAKELVDWLDLSEFRDSKVAGFSAGMKQRLSLGQAMTHQPELLILDEPTANLDPDGRMSLTEKLRQLRQQQNITIFVSSHQLLELEQLVDSVTVIENGRAVVEDSVQDLRDKVTLNQYVLKVSSSEAVLKALQGKACVQGLSVDAEGTIHLTSSDFPALQREVIAAVTAAAADIELFGKEQVSLQDIYRETMGRDQ